MIKYVLRDGIYTIKVCPQSGSNETKYSFLANWFKENIKEYKKPAQCENDWFKGVSLTRFDDDFEDLTRVAQPLCLVFETRFEEDLMLCQIMFP